MRIDPRNPRIMARQDILRDTCDVLVIGGGGAGLRAAIGAREAGAQVILVSKTRVGHVTNTYIAKAVIASTGWGDPEDNPHIHMKDTLLGGRFLNDQSLVDITMKEVRSEISFLEKCGIHFAKKQGHFRLLPIPGHSYPRHLRAETGAGRSLVLPLTKYARGLGVRFAEKVVITKLLTRNHQIAAATGVSENGFHVFTCKCVILATGGYAQIYLHTNNPPLITGDGIGLAFQLGVPLKDMEFVQFYPTNLGKRGKRLLPYESLLLHEKALLMNRRGEDILERQGLGDRMSITRDRLSQAIMDEIREGLDVEGGVILDLSALSDEMISTFRPLPAVQATDQRRFVVSPTAHFCMGGVITSPHAETLIPGLFAAGEVCAGVHGANRLAGNALTEVFTMGGIAGRNAGHRVKDLDHPAAPEGEIRDEMGRLTSMACHRGPDPEVLCRSLKRLMWKKAGIIRCSPELEEALKEIRELEDQALKCSVTHYRQLVRCLDLQHMLFLSEALCRAALMRTETRGSHYRSDFPAENNEHWLKNILIRKGDSGMVLERVPVSLDKVTPENGGHG